MKRDVVGDVEDDWVGVTMCSCGDVMMCSCGKVMK